MRSQISKRRPYTLLLACLAMLDPNTSASAGGETVGSGGTSTMRSGLVLENPPVTNAHGQEFCGWIEIGPLYLATRRFPLDALNDRCVRRFGQSCGAARDVTWRSVRMQRGRRWVWRTRQRVKCFRIAAQSDKET